MINELATKTIISCALYGGASLEMSAQGCITSEAGLHPVDRLPDWVPVGVRLYLSHVATGRSLRALARDQGCHASTIMRQVRRLETRRDDPLVDEALRRLDQSLRKPTTLKSEMEPQSMMPKSRNIADLSVDVEIETRAMRYLREMTVPGALLIVASDMPKAVITREDNNGIPQRVAVLDRYLAEAMALMDWITCRAQGRVSSYGISPVGRLALRNCGAEHSGTPDHLAENDHSAPRRIRYGIVESPVTVLARRRDKSGEPFLDAHLVQAAERLREDYVMAQLDKVDIAGPQDLIKALETRKVPGPNVAPPGTSAARKRVLELFRDLGPGLGDMALRCCCRLEGVESAENALGWSARSGKIVLRIALQRMSQQYQCLGEDQMMIG